MQSTGVALGPMHYLLLALFTVTFLLLFQITSILDQLRAPEVSYRASGEPLYLTPFIEAGELQEARNLATVQHIGMENVQSFSGFLTVNREFNSNIFFWFFLAKNDPQHAPVLLWLQGSPGASSLFSLFTENGPFVINDYKQIKYLSPNSREYSWHVNHNIIYMDSPIGTGFSFTDDNRGFATNVTTVANELYSALVQFFLLFPLLTKNEFYIAGESYAGKYIPAVAKVIKDNNPKATVEINLKGLAIGSGLIDPYNQMDYGDYLYQIGLVDFNGREEFRRLENETKNLIARENWSEAYDAMNQLVGGVGVASLFRNLTGFDSSCNYLNASESDSSSWFLDYLERPDIRRALHVGGVQFGRQSNSTLKYLRLDLPKSTAARYVPELLENYRLLIYNGQLDVLTAAPLAGNFLRSLDWPGAEEYKRAVRRQWWLGEELVGFAKSVGNLTELLVRNAGHRVATDQPKWAWNLITRFTEGRSF